jgi:hypothetical protein
MKLIDTIEILGKERWLSIARTDIKKGFMSMRKRITEQFKVINGLLILFFLPGCINSPEIHNETLNDRVKACSAGFSESAKVSLDASLNKAALSGSITPEVREETKGIIFSEIPDADKIKAYEDYIGCIEKNWNS